MIRNILFLLLVLIATPTMAQSDNSKKKVHYNAFSHNDYTRKRPLMDAYDRGFNCVEADLWYIGGKLYVYHDRPLMPSRDRIFEKMYLEPLIKLIEQNGGRVHERGRKPFMLMIDCKSGGEEMLPALERALEPYKELLCRVENGSYKKGAILIFLSGKSPRKTILERGEGFLFIDGVIPDIGKGYDSHMMPVISHNYAAICKWRGKGEMPQEELEKMREIIRNAHREGKLFRWWGAPDTKEFKRLFIREGVDLIGADNLDILIEVLENREN